MKQYRRKKKEKASTIAVSQNTSSGGGVGPCLTKSQKAVEGIGGASQGFPGFGCLGAVAMVVPGSMLHLVRQREGHRRRRSGAKVTRTSD